MKERAGQTRSIGERREKLTQLSAVMPARADSASVNGAAPADRARRKDRHHAFRRKGPKSAQNLARQLRAGRKLSPDQELLLQITARLYTHLCNASLALYELGELREDGEPRVLLSRLLELERAVRDNLARLFPEQADDSLAALIGRRP